MNVQYPQPDRDKPELEGGPSEPVGIAGGSSDDADGDGCHDSYKGACVPPDIPDVECEDVPAPVTIVGEEEYGLDGGYGPEFEPPDGVGCELSG